MNVSLMTYGGSTRFLCFRVSATRLRLLPIDIQDGWPRGIRQEHLNQTVTQFLEFTSYNA